MRLQKFSNFIGEADAKDYIAPKDSDDEAIKYKPRSKGEEEFVAKHKVTKSDAEPRGQDHIFNGSIKEEVEVEDEKKKLDEGVLDTLRKIVKDKQAQKIKFKNGKQMMIDMQTANMITKSFDKRIKKADTKAKVEKLLDSGPEGLMKVLDIMQNN
jgi:hypothetical protein